MIERLNRLTLDAAINCDALHDNSMGLGYTIGSLAYTNTYSPSSVTLIKAGMTQHVHSIEYTDYVNNET